MISKIFKHALCLFFILSCIDMYGKREIIVTDSLSGESLPFATIESLDKRIPAAVTDSLGKLKLVSSLVNRPLKISYSGYQPVEFTVSPGDTNIYIKLVPLPITLSEIQINPQKGKYKKKNNPAVDFVKKLRTEAKAHNPKDSTYYSYDKYEKMLIGINNFQAEFDESGFLGKKAAFLKNYVDTSEITGQRLLDLILKEKYSTQLFGSNPKLEKEVIHGYRSAGIDEFVSEQNMRILLEDVVREVDVFEPNINILQNRFVSPLSAIGPDFYKYYLSDTVYIGKDKCIELTFVPHNPQSMGFNGKLYVVEGDSDMFVKKITMRTPHDINLNFLKNLYINQSFQKDSAGNRHKYFDDIVIEMQIVRGTPEFYGRKTTLYDNFNFKKRKDLNKYYEKSGFEFNLTDSISDTAEFWNEKRMVPLSPAESRIQGLNQEMRKVPLFYWAEKVVGLLESGYFTTGKPSKVDIGPINTFLSYNSVEGLRIRVGGMTMAPLNPHLFLRAYGAYGFKDHKWKYGALLEYSFVKKEHHSYEWPRHGLYASYTYDLDLIGQHYLFTNQDNVVLSIKRKSSDLVTYRRLAEAGYVLELPNNFSVEAGLKYSHQEATRWLPFVRSNGKNISAYNQGSFNVTLRWAKGEKFVQGRSNRLWVNMDPWIIQLSHEYGPKGLFDAAFTTNQTELSIQKRFWLSAFGYIDVIAKAGKVWSGVYYPALMWPNANLSYTIQPESYSLMDPMEFANDAYAALDFTYFGNGILFNHIPLINKLKLREAVTFKGLEGTLSDRNNPYLNEKLLMFPKDCLAMKMKKTPYMEIGVGIDNILSVLRVDYVWRLTYRDNPGVDKSGVRVSLHFTL